MKNKIAIICLGLLPLHAFGLYPHNVPEDLKPFLDNVNRYMFDNQMCDGNRNRDDRDRLRFIEATSTKVVAWVKCYPLMNMHFMPIVHEPVEGRVQCEVGEHTDYYWSCVWLEQKDFHLAIPDLKPEIYSFVLSNFQRAVLAGEADLNDP